jgi:hypothetical protein
MNSFMRRLDMSGSSFLKPCDPPKSNDSSDNLNLHVWSPRRFEVKMRQRLVMVKAMAAALS